MDFNEAQKILLEKREYSQAFNEMSLAFDIARLVIQAREERAMTQEQLASLVRTGQSSIARLESGDRLPSLSFLQKIAMALDMILLPPLFISKEEVAFLSSSNADTNILRIEIIETRKVLASNRNTPVLATTSANSNFNIT